MKMKLTLDGIKDKKSWEAAGVVLPSYDIEKVKERIISRLEEEMADKIVNKIVTEFSNDIKQIMCNRELREDLRYYMRTKIEEINDKVMV